MAFHLLICLGYLPLDKRENGVGFRVEERLSENRRSVLDEQSGDIEPDLLSDLLERDFLLVDDKRRQCQVQCLSEEVPCCDAKEPAKLVERVW